METCPICLEAFDESKTTTNCNHAFCSVCINELMENNKIECPMCRTVIKEYSNKDEKVKVLLKNVQRRSSSINQSDINVSLITRDETRRNNRKVNFYILLYVYLVYIYMKNSYVIYHLKNLYNDCQEINVNLTDSFNEIINNGVSVAIYDDKNDMFSKVCQIPIYFYKKCFNL
jgi:hypothetical protein